MFRSCLSCVRYTPFLLRFVLTLVFGLVTFGGCGHPDGGQEDDDEDVVEGNNTDQNPDAELDAPPDTPPDLGEPDGESDTSETINPPEGMVHIPAGEFLRGSDREPDEMPMGEIYLSDFWIDQTEVTVEAYDRCVFAGACLEPGACDFELDNWDNPDRRDHPINCVNWMKAETYCRFAGKRLPTEAEWEKAARGTDGRTYPWGEARPSCTYAVFNYSPGVHDPIRDVGCGEKRTWPVGSKPAGASPYGVLDMAGNVAEWVADWYHPNTYALTAGMSDPTGPGGGTERIARGGGLKEDYDIQLRTTTRFKHDPYATYVGLGFRCAWSP